MKIEHEMDMKYDHRLQPTGDILDVTNEIQFAEWVFPNEVSALHAWSFGRRDFSNQT